MLGSNPVISTNMAAGNQLSPDWVLLRKHEFVFRGAHKQQSNSVSNTNDFSAGKIPRIVSFLGRHINAASRKSVFYLKT